LLLDLLRIEEADVVCREFAGTDAIDRVFKARVGVDQPMMLNGVSEQSIENFSIGIQRLWTDGCGSLIQVSVDDPPPRPSTAVQRNNALNERDVRESATAISAS
jgi:hypothetical protein